MLLVVSRIHNGSTSVFQVSSCNEVLFAQYQALCRASNIHCKRSHVDSNWIGLPAPVNENVGVLKIAAAPLRAELCSRSDSLAPSQICWLQVRLADSRYTRQTLAAPGQTDM